MNRHTVVLGMIRGPQPRRAKRRVKRSPTCGRRGAIHVTCVVFQAMEIPQSKKAIKQVWARVVLPDPIPPPIRCEIYTDIA